MAYATPERAISAQPPVPLRLGRKLVIALLCLCAGVAPLAARSIPDDRLRVACGSILAAAYLGVALLSRRQLTAWSKYADLSFAFFIFAFIQVLNNAVPGFFGTQVLRDPPNAGDPLASTISGSVAVQLLETLLVLVPVAVLTRAWGNDLGSVYLRAGVRGRWLALAIVFFVAFYGLIATVPLPRLFPTNGGPLSLAHFLALTPPLIVVALSNGLEEEVLFRGLFLRRYERLFGA